MLNTVVTEADEKIAFSLRLNLACDAGWVQAPAHLDLMNMSRQFLVKIDAQGLESGAYYTEVRCPFMVRDNYSLLFCFLMFWL